MPEATRRQIEAALAFLGILAILFFLMPPLAILDPWKSHLRYIALLANLCCFCIYFWKVRIDIVGACAIGYFAVLALDAIVTQSSLLSCCKYNLPFTSALLLGRSLYPVRKKELLWAVTALLGTYSLINAADLIATYFEASLFSDGFIDGFLGNRNSFSRYYLAAIVASGLLDYFRRKKLSPLTLLLFLAAIVQAYILPSATSSMALAFFVAAFILIHTQTGRRILNAPAFGIAYLIAFLGIVVLRFQNLFAFFIEGTLRKNLTFTGRTAIWDTILQRLGSDPLHLFIGFYGDGRPLSETNPAITTGHNFILDVTYNAGLIGLACIATIFVVAMYRLYKNRTNYPAALLAAYLGAFLILGLMEHVTCAQLWLFLGIAGSITAIAPSQDASSLLSLGADTSPSKHMQ